MKCLIGKRTLDNATKQNNRYWTFTVKEDTDHYPVVEVEHEGKIRYVKAEEISAKVLKKMKETAEMFLRKNVSKAVITVPAYFSLSQRKATINAAKMAGLEVLELVTEPAASAYAYGFDTKKYSDYNLLVFDLGGGTFDVVVVSVKNGQFKVKAVGGSTELGGRDFDNKLLDYFADTIKAKYKKDCFSQINLQQKLLKECIQIKQALTTENQTQ